jgi:hypothetical protein
VFVEGIRTPKCRIILGAFPLSAISDPIDHGSAKIQPKSRCHTRNTRIVGPYRRLYQSVRSKFPMPRNNGIGTADQRKSHSPEGRKNNKTGYGKPPRNAGIEKIRFGNPRGRRVM